MSTINSHNVYNPMQVDRAAKNTASNDTSAVFASSNAFHFDWFVLSGTSASINQEVLQSMSAIGPLTDSDAIAAQPQSVEARVERIVQHILTRG